MSKKITLTISGSKFDIELEEEFAAFLLKQIDEDFNPAGNNDIKVLLQAYVRKNYKLYENMRESEKLLKQLEAALGRTSE